MLHIGLSHDSFDVIKHCVSTKLAFKTAKRRKCEHFFSFTANAKKCHQPAFTYSLNLAKVKSHHDVTNLFLFDRY